MEKLAGVASLGKFLAMNTLKLIDRKEFETVDYCGSGPFGVYSKWSSEVVYRKKALLLARSHRTVVQPNNFSADTKPATEDGAIKKSL